MSGPAWLEVVPEAVRRRLYAQAQEGEVPLLAVDVPGTERVLPGTQWSKAEGGRTHALCLTPREAVPTLAGTEVMELAAPALYVTEGEQLGTPLTTFVERANTLVSRKDGEGLWRAAKTELSGLEATSRRATTLRWLLSVLEVSRPDQAMVVALLRGLEGPWVAPVPDEKPRAAVVVQRPPVEEAVRVLQSQLMMLSVPCDPDVVDGRLMAVSTVVQRVLSVMDLASYVEAADQAVREALEFKSAEPVRRFLLEVLALWKEPAEAPAPEAASPEAKPVAGEDTHKKESVKVLKVEPERIEALMKLVGELVVAKNALPFLARKAEEASDARALSLAIRDQYSVVNRITEELQGAVMRVRMVSMSTVFRRFPRLVRDLSGKLNKRIRLDLEGEDTEADKDVVQDLFDPLMHLMRNSIDHGLEGPEERERAGKGPEGTIRINAVQQEDQVVIELSDDGRGIDPERIKRKAIEKGFLRAEDAARLSDEDALQLIFLPGFSTAEQVTDLSGRGVGMDVVRSMVGRVGGQITLHSKLGKGTTTTITLPLTMAVSHVMIVEVGGLSIGVPFSSIVETVRVTRSSLKPVQDGEALVLRNRLVPVCRLARTLELTPSPRADGTEAILVAKVAGELIAVVVDEFQEAVDVISRPLEGVLAGLDRYSGTALLGDGRLVLILDLGQLITRLR